MATVIDLKERAALTRRHTRKPSEAGALAARASAEILLFTGVRYERYQPGTAPENNPSHGGTRRARKR